MTFKFPFFNYECVDEDYATVTLDALLPQHQLVYHKGRYISLSIEYLLR